MSQSIPNKKWKGEQTLTDVRKSFITPKLWKTCANFISKQWFKQLVSIFPYQLLALPVIRAPD